MLNHIIKLLQQHHLTHLHSSTAFYVHLEVYSIIGAYEIMLLLFFFPTHLLYN